MNIYRLFDESFYYHFWWSYTVLNSKPRLLNWILLNLIVRLPTERSHYTNNLWNATFGLWKIRIMNGWMVSFEWKTSKHHKNKELVGTLWKYCYLEKKYLLFDLIWIDVSLQVMVLAWCRVSTTGQCHYGDGIVDLSVKYMNKHQYYAVPFQIWSKCCDNLG